jgi:phenylpropionate dioxygenase-like ring-hydroxylating dioxygenase large terminal subunit
MADDGTPLAMLRPANSPNAFDLRRVGAHPDHWYPVAWANELAPGKPLGRRFAGDPIVLYRGREGRIYALEDRCAHRQVPLHLGVVEGERLKCHYHGWAYDGTGRCVDVPYLDDCLPNGVKAYPAREVDDLIFIFPGDPALAESRLPTTLGAFRRKEYKTRRLNRQVSCHYTFMHENLFDMNHQFMHRKLMGSIKARCLGRSHGEDWAQVEYSFTRLDGKQSMGEKVIIDLMRERGVVGKPDFSDHMRIRTDYPTQSLKVWIGRNIQESDDPALDVWLGYTPLDAEQKTNRTYGYLSVKRPPVPGLIEAVWPFVVLFTEGIFREDKDIVEFEQRAYDAQGADWNNEVFPAIRDLREVLARCGAPAAP